MQINSRNSSDLSIELSTRRQRVKELSNVLAAKFKQKLVTVVTLSNIVNLIFLLSVSYTLIQQCNIQISEYLEFRTKFQVSHVFPESAIWLLPGVTICNNNRVRIERLIEESPELQRRIEQIINSDSAILSDAKRIDWLIAMKDALDSTFNMSELIMESPLQRLMYLSRANLIKDVNCNTLWGKQLNCENFPIIESYQSAPCYTLFHLGSYFKAMGSNTAYDFKTSLLGGKRKIGLFDSHEIADILIDFEPLQQADYQRSSGGHVVIHSTAHVGSVRDVAHPIQAGQKYEIMLERTMTKRLPAPYKSKCTDYKKKNQQAYYENRAFASLELDRTTCIRNCVLRQATSNCNCWPVEVPYFPGDPMINGSDFLKLCSWAYERSQKEHSAELYINCYKRFLAKCETECNLSCRTEDYKVRVVSSSWPARERFLLANSELERREMHRLKGCCAMISIKYLHYHEQRNVMYPNMTLAQMVSNLGGIISALVGVSSITIYRFVTRKILKCKVVNDHHLQPTGKTPVLPASKLIRCKQQMAMSAHWRRLARAPTRRADLPI